MNHNAEVISMLTPMRQMRVGTLRQLSSSFIITLLVAVSLLLFAGVTPAISGQLASDESAIRPTQTPWCGARQSTETERQALEEQTARWLKNHPQRAITTATIEIPVWFNIVRSSGWNVTLVPLVEQIAVWNSAFSPSNFHFVFAGYNYVVNNDWTDHTVGDSDAINMMQALHKCPELSLNVYICQRVTAPGGYELTGYSSFPWDYYEGNFQHGVVLEYTALPGGTEPGNNEGDVAVHEVGHYLGLFHTFEGNNCTGPGDLVSDTPAELTAASDCPTGRDSCPGEPGVDPINNYMDYTSDACRVAFTSGQTARMHQQTAQFRPTLIQPTPLTPRAEATPAIGSCPLQVQFTDTSIGCPIGWQWFFEDGTPPDNSPNPTHLFTEPGSYDVRLRIFRVDQEATAIVRTITVNAPDPALVTLTPSGCSYGSIQAAIESGASEIHIRPGTYSSTVQRTIDGQSFVGFGFIDRPVTIRREPGATGEVILQGGSGKVGFVLGEGPSGLEGVRIEGLSIKGCDTGIVFIDRSPATPYDDLVLSELRLIDNSTGVSIGGGYDLTLEQSLIDGGTTGIDLVGPYPLGEELLIQRNTLVNQTLAGLRTRPSMVTSNELISNCIFYGSMRGVSNDVATSIDVRCSFFYRNILNFVGGADFIGYAGNKVLDPEFCDPLNGVYTVAADSPCLSGSGACSGQTGAFGQDCSEAPYFQPIPEDRGLVHFDGFETKDLSLLSSADGPVFSQPRVSVTLPGGRFSTPGVQIASVPSGYTAHARVKRIDGTGHLWENLDLEDCFVSVAFKEGAAWLNDNQRVEFLAFTGSGGRKLTLAVENDGGPHVIVALDSDGLPLGTVGLVPGNGYVWIDVYVGTESGSGAGDAPLVIRLNGETEMSFSRKNLGEFPTDFVSLGTAANPELVSFEWFFDNIVVSSKGWSGYEPHVRRADPIGDGSPSAWLPMAGLAKWPMVDDLHQSSASMSDGDLTYIHSDPNADNEEISFVTEDVHPSTWEMLGVTSWAWLRDEAGLTRFRLLLNDPTGQTASPFNWDASAVWQFRHILAATRADGKRWTIADVYDAEVGLVDYTSGGPMIRCSAAGLLVLGQNAPYLSSEWFASSTPDEPDGGAIAPDMGRSSDEFRMHTRPNPASSAVSIHLDIPENEAGGAEVVEVAAFDVVGRRVANVFTGNLGAGSHHLEWDLRDTDNRRVVSGIYFVKSTMRGRTVTQRVIAIR